jgi:plasmid stability protein
VSRDRENVVKGWERFQRGVLEEVPAEATATHLALADAYLEMGLLDDAEAEFALVLEVQPDDPSGRAGLELVRLQRNPLQRVRIGNARQLTGAAAAVHLSSDTRRDMDWPVSQLDSIDCTDIVDAMASITIRNLDPELKRELRVRAARRGHSVAAEIRRILHEAITRETEPPIDVAAAIAALFRPLGGVDPRIPPRDPMREPLKLR